MFDEIEEKMSISSYPPFYPLPEYKDFQNAMSKHLMKNVHPVQVPDETNYFPFQIELGEGPVMCAAYTIPMIRAILKPDLRKKPLRTFACLPVKSSKVGSNHITLFFWVASESQIPVGQKRRLSLGHGEDAESNEVIYV